MSAQHQHPASVAPCRLLQGAWTSGFRTRCCACCGRAWRWPTPLCTACWWRCGQPCCRCCLGPGSGLGVWVWVLQCGVLYLYDTARCRLHMLWFHGTECGCGLLHQWHEHVHCQRPPVPSTAFWVCCCVPAPPATRDPSLPTCLLPHRAGAAPPSSHLRGPGLQPHRHLGRDRSAKAGGGERSAGSHAAVPGALAVATTNPRALGALVPGTVSPALPCV